MSNQQNIDQFFNSFMEKVASAQQRLPNIIGTEIINSSLDNFKNESFEVEKWAPRKDKKNKRKTLVKTGKLQRSPRIVRTGTNRVEVGSDIPYASVHNNGETINRAARSELFIRNRHKKGKLGKMFGGMGAFRKGTTKGKGMIFKSHSISMPRRQFLGVGPKTKKHLENVIREELTKELNK